MTHTPKHEKSFLDAKRRDLEALRDSLLRARERSTADQAGANATTSGEARQYEDEAQKLVTLELEGTLEVRDTARLETIERALRKIDEGTYGLSDESGEPIPRARLDAVPEAIYTLAEQAVRDQRGV